MPKFSLVLGALLGGFAVALGAFGAHRLQRMTGDEVIHRSFQTAVQYQMYHALALLAVGVLLLHQTTRFLRSAAICFVAGVLLFSGSLYAITILKMNGCDIPTALALLTPAGGIFFIAGWVSLLVSFLWLKRSE